MPYTNEVIARLIKQFEEATAKDRDIARSLPDAISSGDLDKILRAVVVIIGGRSFKVESIRCVAEDGSTWNPVNMNGLRDKFYKEWWAK